MAVRGGKAKIALEAPSPHNPIDLSHAASKQAFRSVFIA